MDLLVGPIIGIVLIVIALVLISGLRVAITAAS